MVLHIFYVLLMCILRYRSSKFSLSFLNILLQKLWMIPLRRITCANTIEVFKKLLNSLRKEPEKIQTDMESFKIATVQDN